MTNNILLATIVGGGVTLCGVLPGAAAPRQNSFGSFESFESQAAAHAAQRAKLPRAVLRPVQPRTAQPAARVATPRNFAPAVSPQGANLANARRLADAHAARGLRDMRDLAGTVRNVPGFTAGNGGELNRNPGGDLTKRDRGILGNGFAAGMANREGNNSNKGFENPLGDLMPDLPSNNNHSAGLRPSGNLRDHAAGIASHTPARVRTNPDGTTVKSWSYYENGERVQRTSRDNQETMAHTEITERRNLREGTHSTHRVEHNTGDNKQWAFFGSYDRSGGWTTSRGVRNSGERFWRWTTVDRRGRITDSDDSDRHPSAGGRNGGINRTLDPNADTNAGVMGPWIDVRPSHVADPTKVNPGSAENLPGPQAPRLNPGSSIVVNPSLTETTGPNRAIDPETARRMFEAAKPDPGGRPPRNE